MADEQKKSPVSAAAIAAFLAGAGFGVGTEIVIRPPPIGSDAGSQGAWTCTVIEEGRVFCKDPQQVEVPSEDLVVRLDGGDPDAGTADAGTPDAGSAD